MSDLFEAREKVEKGAEWRGEINAEIDGETQQLTVRQLFDPEQWEVMSQIDMDELEALQEDLPEDKMEELAELRDSDSLTDDEQDRLEELQDELDDGDINIFDELSYETYKGLMTAAKYGIVPDDADVRYALTNHADEIEESYGSLSNDAAKQYVNDTVITPMIERSTDFTSFAIGVKVIGETLGDTKN